MKPTQGRADLARVRRASDAVIAGTSPPDLANLPADLWTDAVQVEPVAKTPISLRPMTKYWNGVVRQGAVSEPGERGVAAVHGACAGAGADVGA